MEQINLQQAKVAVIGAGTMGIGIAQLAAMHGHLVYIFDVDVVKAQSALDRLLEQLHQRVQAGKMPQQLVDYIIAHLTIINNIQALADVDLVIEAILEKKEVKQALFQQLANICSENTIFASNTSSISITALAANIPTPERVIGLHFFNPAPVMKLVEIVRGLKSSTRVTHALFALMQSWNKVPVIAKSTPGFIVNRVARPYYSEAFRALQENVITPEQLDYVMRECGGFAMGPCELTDLIGQDVNFSVTHSVYQEFFYEPRYRPSFIQKELVDAGCYGRKSLQGFYDYHQAIVSPQYEVPVKYIKFVNKLCIVVKGKWQHSQALIHILKQATHVDLYFEQNQSERDEIVIGEVSLRLSHGESVDLDYANQKVVLMDWHSNWKKAKVISVVASAECTSQDCDLIDYLFIGLNVIPLWNKDYAGLYVLRTIAMLVNEGCEAVLHHISSEQDIDLAMKYGVNYPQGPFEWAGKIGYDIILQILENMYRIYGEERYRPSLYLKKKVALGQSQHNGKEQQFQVAG